MTHASVFSGIGGPEVAATMLGWENLFHCEINPFGRAVLDYWYPNAKSYDDITKTDFSEWRGKIDVLTGGFPCQPFSYAGQRRGSQDDRYLWPYMFKCIDAIRPTWVVAENVAGILTMVEQGEVSPMETQGTLFGEDNPLRRYRLRETFTIERICHDLERHGYAVQPVLVPACAVGACHRRDRVFIVGVRVGRFQPLYDKDTMCVGLYADKKLGNIERQRNTRTNGFDGYIEKAVRFRTEWTGKGWRPSVTITHRGNDGLPFNVGDIAISPSKWRTESLKAYGNAIVPEVMYEIFRAIQLTEEQSQNYSNQ